MAKYPDLTLVLLGDGISRAERILAGRESFHWLYFGKDFLKLRALLKELNGRAKYIDIVRFLDQVADEIRKEHVEWIDALNREHGKSLEWWFGPVSSRNVSGSNLFQYSCYLEVLKRLWHEKGEKPDIIFLESAGLAKVIRRWAWENSITVSIIYKRQLIIKPLINGIRFLVRWADALINILSRCLAAFISRGRYRGYGLTRDASVIIDTFLHKDSLSSDASFKDRYFPYLHEYLRREKIITLVHPVLYGFRYSYLFFYKKMRKSPTVFIIREDHLCLPDYMRAFLFPAVVLNFKNKAVFFRGFNLTDILREDSVAMPVASGIEAVLIDRLFMRLGTYGLHPKTVINWYENQVIDKALVASAKRAFPGVRIVGAQMFIHPPNLLNLYPSQSELEAGFVPDLLLETSEYQCQRVKLFTSDIVCHPAASLRYEHVFNGAAPACQPAENGRNILVLLSFDIPESVEILERFQRSLELIGKDVKVKIKCHPDYTPETFLKILEKKDLFSRFEFVNDALSSLLACASIVISSSSSPIVEAAARGIPGIYIGRQTVFNQNVFSKLNLDMVRECFTVSELAAAINHYIDLNNEEKVKYKETGNRIKEMFFTPLCEETMLPFLDRTGEDILCRKEN